MDSRLLNSKQVKDIFKGKDLEFRIVPYEFKIGATVSLKDQHVPKPLTFENCYFKELIFDGTRASASLRFVNCRIDRFSLINSQLHSVEFEHCRLGELEVTGSQEFYEFRLNSSKCDSLKVTDNPIYKRIHIGCGSFIKKGVVTSNGSIGKNSFESEIFFCPECFNEMLITDNCSEILEVGTFGEYANLRIERNKANMVVFSNCDPKYSVVSIEHIEPFKKENSSIEVVNSEVLDSILKPTDLSQYKEVKKI
ncbi:hypothetical protein [Roseivirga pacifica]|uniref:hypothetical protein n=1 Tax=Roseivirga pacifica TaxID=1267423 RepID=UPI003BB125F0